MNLYEQIRNFTSVAPIPVSWAFGARAGFGYQIVERHVETVVYREQSSSYSYGRSSDDGYGFAGGFLLGSMF